MFRDRILLNRYQLYVANLLYDGCREEGYKRGITMENVALSSLSVDSIVSDASSSSSSLESQDESPIQDDYDDEARFKNASQLVSALIGLFRRNKKPGKLSLSRSAKQEGSSRPSGHIRLFPLLDFNSFKKNAKVFRSDFTLIKSEYDDKLTAVDAKRRAKFIFEVLRSVSEPARGYLTIQDIQKIFKSKTSASEAYRIFDINNDGQMSKSELKRSLIHIYRENQNLKQSVLSSAEALSALDVTLSATLFVILVLVYMIIFGIQIQSLLTLSLSLILGFNAIIGNMSRDMFDSLCFLFITHPFDIGDRVKIEGDQNVYEVKQIYVLRTEFLDVYGEEVYIPNPVLIRKNIINLRRSQEQWETIDIYTDPSTAEEQLYQFRSDITRFLKNNPSYFHHKFDMESFDCVPHDLNVYPIRLRIQCKVTKDNMRRADRHHFLLNFIKVELEKLRIVYYPKGPSGPPVILNEAMAASAAKREDHFKRHMSTAGMYVGPESVESKVKGQKPSVG